MTLGDEILAYFCKLQHFEWTNDGKLFKQLDSTGQLQSAHYILCLQLN
jgi:hypothetical protein